MSQNCTNSPRVLLADDHSTLRRCVRLLLENEGCRVVAEATDGAEAVRQAQLHRPNVVILDISMPCLSGFDAGRQILQACPTTAVILFTVHRHRHLVVRAAAEGIHGYVLKSDAPNGLIRAVRSVTRGARYLSRGACAAIDSESL